MATNTITYNGTFSPLSGGIDAISGQGARYRISFTGTWAIGDGYQFNLIFPAQTFTLGQGRVTGTVPALAITLQDRVHFVANTMWFGSDNGDATRWEQQAPNAFSIKVTNFWQQPEPLLSLAPFQGRIMICSRRTVQIWGLNADPRQITVQQVLPNIGAVSPFGTVSIGDLDVLFPSDSGIRSLRVLAINLNGYISDIGSPIDNVIQSAIQGQIATELTGICGVVEPVFNRYMTYIPSTNIIYALSYFPASKIVAWCSYTPTIGQSAGIKFNLSIFKVFNSVVFFSGNTISGTTLLNNTTNFIGCYGTPDGSNTYMFDDTQLVVLMPWLDLKSPGTIKSTKGVDVAIVGQWSIYGSMDYIGVVDNSANLKTIASKVNSSSSGPSTKSYNTAQRGLIPWQDDGYHIQLKVIGDDPAYPGALSKLSEIVLYYEEGAEK